MKDILIKPDKRYLVLSSSTDFLEKMRQIIYAKLNIGDVYDTKSHKNSMIFETIILKDGGFIKFFLYNNKNLSTCTYDIVLVDSILYSEEYSLIRSRCLMANIIAIIDSVNADIDDILHYIDITPPTGVKIKHRKFSHKNYSDYGECEHCGKIVYGYDDICPSCGSELDWHMGKDEIIDTCIKYGGYNDELGTNMMHCDENWYNPYYCLMQTFSMKELKDMEDKEINDLLKLAKKITTGLY